MTVAATASTREPGRFHIGGEFGAVYLALEPETALRELARRASRAGMQVRKLLPRDLLTVELRLAKVLDLTDAAVRAEWGLHDDVVTDEDFTACQEVAAAARRAGYEEQSGIHQRLQWVRTWPCSTTGSTPARPPSSPKRLRLIPLRSATRDTHTRPARLLTPILSFFARVASVGLSCTDHGQPPVHDSGF